MKSNRFLSGIFFLLLGLMWLGVEFGYIASGSLLRLVQFWPLIIIFVGLKLVLKDDWLYTLIGMFAIVLAFTYSAYSQVSINEYFGIPKNESKQTSSIDRVEADKRLVINVDAGAAEVDLRALEDDVSKTTLLSVDSEGMDVLKTEKSTTDGVANVSISEQFEGRVVLGPNNRKLNLRVARNIPVEVVFSTGATKSMMDFTNINLTSFTGKSGATSTEIRVGKSEPKVNILIQSGASDYQVFIPEASAYRVVSRSGLSNITYPGEKSTVIGDDTKESSDYVTAGQKVDFTIESGLTNLKIQKY